MDRYYWRAVYHDGTGISQLETNPKTGGEWSSNDIDMSKLSAIVMEPRTEEYNKVILQVHSGEKAQRFWRQYVCAMGPGVGQRSTTWCLTLEKNGVTFGAFFRPDGSIVLSTDIENGSELFF